MSEEMMKLPIGRPGEVAIALDLQKGEEALDEGRDVLRPSAERRHLDRKNTQAKIEVAKEST